MSTKSYALFDVIGVKQAFAKGSAAGVLQGFWTAADAWTNGVAANFPSMKLAGQNAYQSPSVLVRTFSDSALLSTEEELEIVEFWKLVDSLKKAIDQATNESYVIVNSDQQVAHHAPPVLGFQALHQNNSPAYLNLSGSGPAFVHLFLAEEAIRKQIREQPTWKNYSVYAIDKRSLAPGVTPAATTSFTGLNRQLCELIAVR